MCAYISEYISCQPFHPRSPGPILFYPRVGSPSNAWLCRPGIYRRAGAMAGWGWEFPGCGGLTRQQPSPGVGRCARGVPSHGRGWRHGWVGNGWGQGGFLTNNNPSRGVAACPATAGLAALVVLPKNVQPDVAIYSRAIRARKIYI